MEHTTTVLRQRGPAKTANGMQAAQNGAFLGFANGGDRESIQQAMGHLPPPWEWERLRSAAGLTASEAAVLTGFPANRIRYWETGNGVQTLSSWMDYATRLQEAVAKILAERDTASLERLAPVQASPAVAAQQESIRSALMTLDVWLSSSLQHCSADDAEALEVYIRQTALFELRKAVSILRRHAAGKKEGRKEA